MSDEIKGPIKRHTCPHGVGANVCRICNGIKFENPVSTPSTEGKERPKVHRLPDGDKGTWKAYLCSEADALFDAKDAQIAELINVIHDHAESIKKWQQIAEEATRLLEVERGKCAELKEVSTYCNDVDQQFYAQLGAPICDICRNICGPNSTAWAVNEFKRLREIEAKYAELLSRHEQRIVNDRRVDKS